jgi:glucose-1-phosphate adenylyltransferase
MLLAGGQGSRLGCLTSNIAKPALSFGGKYRIIDFSLSNCVNSNIDTVGVLTQYKPTLLNSYIGIGSAWDLDNTYGGVHILPPFVSEDGGSWYKGTANAIYQNIDFINAYNPEYVLIISGDHIYTMNYEAMLEYHKEKNADVTISVLKVPRKEASRFGIITTDAQDRIVRFTEKPKEPDSNLASMGIYIFSWPLLKKALMEDELNNESDNDFGKNVLPMLLHQGSRLFTFRFHGYWKDVGTIESYYEANMELLKNQPELDIFSSDRRIFSNNEILPPQYIGPNAHVDNCLVGNGCIILGQVKHSVIMPGVYVGEGAWVEESILLPNAKIMNGSWVQKAIIGESATVGALCAVGSDRGSKPQPDSITLIADNSFLQEDFIA